MGKALLRRKENKPVKNTRKKRGFTLIEILIVVVILAILAAMILPRMIMQTENGYIAEAQQNLGAIRSAMVTTIDSGIYTAWQTIPDTDFDAGTGVAAGIGMKAIASTNWDYVCAAATTNCTATRKGGPTAYNGGTVVLSEAGAFSCTTYTLISASKGCRV